MWINSMYEMKLVSREERVDLWLTLTSILYLADSGILKNSSRGIIELVKVVHGDKFRPLITEMSTYWPDFSGDIQYPVPNKEVGHPNPFSAMLGKVFYTSSVEKGSLWEGAYGEARVNLLRFLIDNVTTEMPYGESVNEHSS